MEQLVEDLFIVVRIVATMGFITVGGLVLGIEYKFYKDHFKDTRTNRILFYLLAAATVFSWVFMYIVVFKGFKRTE